MKNEQKEIEQELLKALKEYGYLFPTTTREVEKFELLFGNTDFEMADKFKSPSFFTNKFIRDMKGSEANMDSFVKAIASRKGENISDEDVKRVKEIHKKAAEEAKNNSNK